MNHPFQVNELVGFRPQWVWWSVKELTPQAIVASFFQNYLNLRQQSFNNPLNLVFERPLGNYLLTRPKYIASDPWTNHTIEANKLGSTFANPELSCLILKLAYAQFNLVVLLTKKTLLYGDFMKSWILCIHQQSSRGQTNNGSVKPMSQV